MSRVEYDLLRAERPDLNLHSFEELLSDTRERLTKLTVEQVVAYRSYVLLMRQNALSPTDEDKELGWAFVKWTPV